MGKKYKRHNEAQRDLARGLIQFWYDELSREGATRFARDGRQRSVEVPSEGLSRGDTLADARRERPEHFTQPVALTARGSETRTVNPHAFGVPSGPLTDPAALYSGRQHHGALLAYCRDCMRHVALLNPEARDVLEMDAAGWQFENIAGHIGCSEPMARQFLEAGLAHVMSYRHLIKPKAGA